MITGERLDRGEVLDLYGRHVNAGLARLATLMAAPVVVRAEGDHVYTDDGQELLNCGGFSVFLLGHGYPPVVDAVSRQLRNLALTGPMVYHEELARAAATLAGVCPAGLEYVYFTNSGAEACETALKLARMNGKRHTVATEGGFHGKTLGALSVTGRTAFRAPCEPLPGPVDFVPYGDADALGERLTGDSCVILEPVQGEGGVRVPPPGYLRRVERACRRTGALLIVDEVQTGLGRTGRLWAVEEEGVTPDVLLCGKALGGGVMPVGAVVATPEVFAPLNRDPVLHTSTYGGNPLAAVAVRHTVEAVLREDVPGRTAALEGRLRELLTTALAGCAALVKEVRGRGALFGVEFHERSHAGEFVLELLERGVVVCPTGNALATVRFTPSAFFGERELGRLAAAVEGSAAALGGRHRARRREVPDFEEA
ncbi:aminotransferase class III-fold pyridoxal phosphate-dependent enzyme [Streptomyces sp. VNUA116]|uniref:aspartate aminotransferase family protein n=1 Tax=Streptomyces sp. VNUA116 TaxID=3062449 RepID=UPI0026767B1D|nr:aminotransferase class III-fold pyridoxal phosphate-dependent enzyme [Streptomyces sp. VNUA116]WKU48154.1 aminotransferase class III-fold pyridoxal phosphate-dependent enzyme [Streptomyces sp. VNUA116]